MEQQFQYDVFLSHSAKDKAAVRPSSLSTPTGERAGVRCRSLDLAERLRGDRLNHCVSGILHSAFILHLSPTVPIKGSLAQLLYINWLTAEREPEDSPGGAIESMTYFTSPDELQPTN
jgi:hypothetical protein